LFNAPKNLAGQPAVHAIGFHDQECLFLRHGFVRILRASATV
jgi:hypothetical protein